MSSCWTIAQSSIRPWATAPARNPIIEPPSSCARKSTGRITCWWQPRCATMAAWCTFEIPAEGEKLLREAAGILRPTRRTIRRLNMPMRCLLWVKPNESAEISRKRANTFREGPRCRGPGPRQEASGIRQRAGKSGAGTCRRCTKTPKPPSNCAQAIAIVTESEGDYHPDLGRYVGDLAGFVR